MGDVVKFAVIGDCHFSHKGNYATRDCLGARDKVSHIIEKLNERGLDFVFSLGDLGDGHGEEELPEMLEAFSACRHPVKYAIGNHDLCRRGEVEHMEAAGIPGSIYDFSVSGYRFVVLNGFEISRFSRNEDERAFYWDFRKNNPDVPIQEWPGLLRESTWARLEAVLEDSAAKGELVILFCHVPTLEDACLREPWETEPHAVLVENKKMLALLDRYTHVRAYIAGHYHPGGLSVRNGVMHKTVKSICDFTADTYCIITADKEKIRISGAGAETHFVYRYDGINK